MTTSLWNFWRYASASRVTNTTASGSSPFTWKIGVSSIFATSEQYIVERTSSGREVVKPTWLFTMMCTVPPVKNARACDSCSVSMTTPWPAKAASPWMRIGSTRAPAVSPRRSWRARTEPSTTGIHDLEMRGIERQRHVHVAAGRAQVRREALVVLHVARALQVRGVVLAFEFVEQHRGRFAEHVHQHVEAAAMRHADDAFLDALLSALLDQVVEQRDQRVAAFEREALLADVLGVQVALEAFGGRELPQQVLLLFGGELAREPADQELILQPQALFGVRHVRELRADGAAVGVLELREDFAQLQLAAPAPWGASR